MMRSGKSRKTQDRSVVACSLESKWQSGCKRHRELLGDGNSLKLGCKDGFTTLQIY